jgi:copper(I)-binding protein
MMLALLIAGLALVAVACGDDDPAEDGDGPDPALGEAVAETSNLSIHAPFVPVPPADIAALYFTMVDRDGEGDRLLGATTSAAAMSHLHSTVTEGDTSRMLPVEGGIVLPPEGLTELAPGGMHVMLMALQQPLAEGDTIEVTLQFERAGSVTIDVPVRTYADAEGE